jgi:hypothetical protein
MNPLERHGLDHLSASSLNLWMANHWFDRVPVPLVGYLDFAFTADIDIDLKTTRACPSWPRGNHVRQVALYRAARSPGRAAVCHRQETRVFRDR